MVYTLSMEESKEVQAPSERTDIEKSLEAQGLFFPWYAMTAEEIRLMVDLIKSLHTVMTELRGGVIRVMEINRQIDELNDIVWKRQWTKE